MIAMLWALAVGGKRRGAAPIGRLRRYRGCDVSSLIVTVASGRSLSLAHQRPEAAVTDSGLRPQPRCGRGGPLQFSES